MLTQYKLTMKTHIKSHNMQQNLLYILHIIKISKSFKNAALLYYHYNLNVEFTYKELEFMVLLEACQNNGHSTSILNNYKIFYV